MSVSFTDLSNDYNAGQYIKNCMNLLHVQNPCEEIIGIKNSFSQFLDTGLFQGVGGHFTASAFILDVKRSKVILTLHAKLNRWLQLGGHVEDGETIHEAALREGLEESGLRSLVPCGNLPIDMDAHEIPARGSEPKHFHFDSTFLFLTEEEDIEVTQESLDLRWVDLEQVSVISDESNLRRIVKRLKTLSHLDNRQLALMLTQGD